MVAEEESWKVNPSNAATAGEEEGRRLAATTCSTRVGKEGGNCGVEKRKKEGKKSSVG